MGLDVTHDCFRAAYSTFSRFRNDLAESAGYAVEVIRWTDAFTYPTTLLDWGHITDENIQGIWEKTPDDPLVVLIAHSDCDGIIAVEQQLPLAERLEELAKDMPDLTGEEGECWAVRHQTLRFAKGLREAHSKNEDVEFY